MGSDRVQKGVSLYRLCERAFVFVCVFVRVYVCICVCVFVWGGQREAGLGGSVGRCMASSGSH